MKIDTMTAAISANPSPDIVLQALLAHDLMAFTEFAFGVVRPGILFKPNWHLEAVTYKLPDILARNHANDFRRVVNDPLYRATFPTMRLGATPTARSRPRSGANASRPRSTGRSPGSGET